ncbi:hypothetical protein L0F51_00260 [Afifella sp. H1R]|uniref:phage tail assembly chaperone n=1 Tax=Afifella sp. H1R TaxID=2908841 RepID=UPI001F269138|nr:hypothetical protein [Afifella sp. H1R]MCF1502197.1 hypothetical protein [Afifella sp. H1R]
MAEKKINGRTFKVEPMLAYQAITLQARLLKAAGPALDKLPAIFGGLGKGETAKVEANVSAIAALSSILEKMEPSQVADLMRDVAETAKIERASGHYEPVDFDGDFSGRLGDVIPVMAFVLREQFGDFFRDALGSGSPATAAG